MGKRVVIIGGGIGGLAAALSCFRAGTDVNLLERAADFSEFGAGVQLGPNVTRVLHAWDLSHALDALASFPDRVQVRSALTGSQLGALRLGATARQRYGFPYATMHRADLHFMLLSALKQQTDVALQFNTTLSRFEQHSSGVSVQAVDGREWSTDVLVGADGLWSSVRTLLLGEGKPQFAGHLAYRALAQQSSLPARLRSQQVTVWLGPGMHLVQYPVRRGELLNVVAIVEGHMTGDPAYWNHSANTGKLRSLLSAACPPLQDLLQAIADWRLWALHIRPPMRGPQEHAQGRVALLGDAAHPMLPYLAQGAGMAIEDAQVLSHALAADRPDVAAALQDYAARRWQRNARVQAGALRNGRVFHATGVLRWGRDAAMKLFGERLLDMPWLYRGQN